MFPESALIYWVSIFAVALIIILKTPKR